MMIIQQLSEVLNLTPLQIKQKYNLFALEYHTLLLGRKKSKHYKSGLEKLKRVNNIFLAKHIVINDILNQE